MPYVSAEPRIDGRDRFSLDLASGRGRFLAENAVIWSVCGPIASLIVDLTRERILDVMGSLAMPRSDGESLTATKKSAEIWAYPVHRSSNPVHRTAGPDLRCELT